MYSSLKLKVSNPGNKIYSVAKTRKHKMNVLRQKSQRMRPTSSLCKVERGTLRHSRTNYSTPRTSQLVVIQLPMINIIFIIWIFLEHNGMRKVQLSWYHPSCKRMVAKVLPSL
jgi:hypothetical protein